MLEPRSKGAKPSSDNKIGNGKGTLRLRSKGPATVEDEASAATHPYAVKTDKKKPIKHPSCLHCPADRV